MRRCCSGTVKNTPTASHLRANVKPQKKLASLTHLSRLRKSLLSPHLFKDRKPSNRFLWLIYTQRLCQQMCRNGGSERERARGSESEREGYVCRVEPEPEPEPEPGGQGGKWGFKTSFGNGKRFHFLQFEFHRIHPRLSEDVVQCLPEGGWCVRLSRLPCNAARCCVGVVLCFYFTLQRHSSSSFESKSTTSPKLYTNQSAFSMVPPYPINALGRLILHSLASEVEEYCVGDDVGGGNDQDDQGGRNRLDRDSKAARNKENWNFSFLENANCEAVFDGLPGRLPISETNTRAREKRSEVKRREEKSERVANSHEHEWPWSS